ncbi:MAG TPA: NIPSNAP family protein [Gemmatimonadaceae bacterium]|nr:NIPSNAP family protein [Gemmatimonadaceae bacterium]
MDRREFLATTAATAAAAAPLGALERVSGSAAARQFIELRRYHLLPGAKQKAFTDFVGDAAIPAMNRAGIPKVGAFTVLFGENKPTLVLVLTHTSLDSVVSLRDRLAADTTFARDGTAILDASMSDPAFVRAESTLLRAFESMPTLDTPVATTTPRMFELRTYESHSDRAALNKIRMFNAGEVPIFRNAGLTPVFFGETVVGAGMPSLTYMVTFPDLAARERGWTAFGNDPAWKTLSADAQYRDNVSAITDIILRPTSFSQI